MEILIIGGLFVGFMVWASTRIKRNAAAAYEPESIDTEKFTLTKPDGFLHPIEDDGPPFRAFTKDFGTGDNGRTRQAEALLTITAGRELNTAVAEAVALADTVLEREERRTGTMRETRLVIERSPDGVQIDSFYRFVDTGEELFEFRIDVLRDHRGDLEDRTNKMLDSLDIK